MKKIKDNIFSFKFQCVRCGNCCTMLPEGIPLFYKDAKRIALFLSLSIDAFLLQYCGLVLNQVVIKGQEVKIPVLYLKTFDRICIFYKKCDNECLIQKAKPYVCKAAPLISLPFQNKESAEFLKKHCKGFGNGTYYSKKKVKSIFEQEAKLEEKEWQLFNDGLYDYLINLFSINKEVKK
ncbi:MAG: YkgJ family cysteine cluster protein [bacterium]